MQPHELIMSKIALYSLNKFTSVMLRHNIDILTIYR